MQRKFLLFLSFSFLNALQAQAAPCATREVQTCLDEQNYRNFSKLACMPCCNLYFDAEFLWWKAENQGFSYAFNQTVDTITFPNVGNVIRIHPDWDPGFRLGFGWNTSYDSWELLAKWTWYNNHSEKTTQLSNVPAADLGQGLYPMWPAALTVTGGTDLGPYTEVGAHWNLHFNSIDLELGRPFFPTQTLLLRPHFGGRGAWLHQSFANHFRHSINPAHIAEFRFDGKNRYWGVGPRMGFDGEWHLGRGFSLLGKIASSLLYGQTKVENLSQGPSSATGQWEIHHLFNDRFDQLVPNLQMLFGIQWGTSFRCDTLYFGMNASWETNYWWNQFNIPVSFEGYAAPMPTVGNQPLTMEGLTLNFQLDF